MKQSAIDYLIEFLSKEKENLWLKEVVICYLNSRESFSEENIKNLTNKLLTGFSHNSNLNYSKLSSNSLNTIRINKLHHESGINALSKNQEIVFGKDVTILYGLNGSGKSSYFRILQGMIGNIYGADIISNIYNDKPLSINTKLDYNIGEKNEKVFWNNTGFISELNTVKVFNSEYSNGFLEKRSADELIINPYKLNVFSELSSYVDKIKNNANSELDYREKNIVKPNIEKFTENHKILVMEKRDKEAINLISKNFNKEKEDKLLFLQKEVKKLVETNYNDKLTIAYANKKQIEQLKKRVDENLISWVEQVKKYDGLIDVINNLEEKSKDNRKKVEILNQLPGVDSEEWKKFIQEGLSISSNHNELYNICPYCHREYDNKSLEIIKAYSIFITDRIEEDLEKYKNEVKEIISSAKHFKFIENDYICYTNKDLNELIIKLTTIVKNYVEDFIKMDRDFKNINIINFDITQINRKFSEHLNELDNQINQIRKDDIQKKEKLNKNNKEISILISEQSIHNQLDIINNYFGEYLEIQELREKVNAFSSNKITRISKDAHKELLTDKLVVEFNEYLDKFGISDRKIELSGKNIKGRQQIELVMSSKNPVNKILSEGEQKAVSIALFLAEIKVSQNKSTVIFDDPVNSLDHRMIERLSDIILDIENQVIIFTHNRMFLDSIYGSDKGHLCKNFNNKGCNNEKGKHIFVYEIKSEGINNAGVITSRIKNNSEGYLKEAEVLLKQSPFSEEEKVSVLLRNSIDHIIDEVIFNRQIPRKYSMKGNSSQSINWDELSKMSKEPNIIDDLKRIFGRVSSGYLHYGQVNLNNPPNKEELQNFLYRLKEISKLKN